MSGDIGSGDIGSQRIRAVTKEAAGEDEELVRRLEKDEQALTEDPLHASDGVGGEPPIARQEP